MEEEERRGSAEEQARGARREEKDDHNKLENILKILAKARNSKSFNKPIKNHRKTQRPTADHSLNYVYYFT